MAISEAERKRLRRVLKTQIPFPFDIDPFLDRAIRQFPENPADFAFALIIKSKPFRRRFPGIFKGDGTLRISPSEYISREEQFKSSAAQFGFKLTRKQVGGLVSKNVDAQEFTTRARGVQLARQNPQLVEFLNRQIGAINRRRRTSLAGGPVGVGLEGFRNREELNAIPQLRTRKDIVDFFSGRGDRQLYRVYEAALFQTAAQESGLDVSGKRGRRLAARTAGVLGFEEVQQGFADIAAQIRTAGVELRAFGISQRDLETIEFGGPGQADLASRAEQALRQRQARLQAQGPASSPIAEAPEERAGL